MKAYFPVILQGLLLALCVPIVSQADSPALIQAQPAAAVDNWEFRPLTLPDLAGVLKAARPNPHIYGLYTWAGEYKKYYDSIQKVGWRSFRNGGPFDDEAMRLYAAGDVQVMPCLAPPGKYDIRPNADNAGYIPQYAQLLAAFAQRYGPGGSFFKENPAVPNRPVRDIEICNEPNFQYLIPDGPPRNILEAQREALYAKLLPAAYNAIKGVSPSINVVGFSTGGSGHGDVRFIQHVHELNPAAAKSYDILSTHPYSTPAPPEAWAIRPWGGFSTAGSLAEIRAILAQYGRAGVPIWYTEVGWPISQKDGGLYAAKGPYVSPVFQAAYVCRLYALAQRLGVQRVDIMFAADTDGFNGGFFLQDGSWRPSAYAVQNMIHLMPAPKLLEAITDGIGGTFIYRFAPSESPVARPVIMAWNVAGPKTIDLPFAGKSATVSDMLGHSRAVTPVNAQLHVEIGPLPTYIQPDQGG